MLQKVWKAFQRLMKTRKQAPAFTIASNAGFDGALPTLQLRIPFLISGIQFFSYWRSGSCLGRSHHSLRLESFANLSSVVFLVYGVYVDMVERRIIDPLKVVRMALVDTASISLLLTTSEATVFDHPNEKNKPPSRMPNILHYLIAAMTAMASQPSGCSDA
ncbi:hypothetical protein CMV_019748 [Castanea mollissima]|uniref:Uncharacterized protein n=1 Tax=Castanea mollissima TaxID=60419 RepID=A0A8J4QNZ8_9ROSI|nr:hypothetical protein CMV_019748 [Castanea mollissima]